VEIDNYAKFFKQIIFMKNIKYGTSEYSSESSKDSSGYYVT